MRGIRSWLIGVVAVTLASPAFGQGSDSYPNRPIRMIIPYSAGGVSDIMGRVLAQKMTEIIGQSIVVDNRAGAGGTLGTDIASKSAPDGYTIVLTSLTTHAIAPHILKAIPYDPVKDFTAIGGVAISLNVLTANTALPFQTLKEMVAYAKANPGKLTYGSSGVGSVGHLSGEVLRTATGLDLLHIPYKSAGLAYPDMIAGNVSLVFDTLPSAIQYIRSGRVRAIGMLSDHRSPLLPDVVTFAEAGYPEATLRFWLALHAPPNLPAPITQKLSQTLNQALAAPDLRERFTNLGADTYPTTPKQLSDVVRADVEKLGVIVRAAKIPRE